LEIYLFAQQDLGACPFTISAWRLTLQSLPILAARLLFLFVLYLKAHQSYGLAPALCLPLVRQALALPFGLPVRYGKLSCITWFLLRDFVPLPNKKNILFHGPLMMRLKAKFVLWCDSDGRCRHGHCWKSHSIGQVRSLRRHRGLHLNVENDN